MLRKTSSYVFAVLLIMNLCGCMTMGLCSNAVIEHRKPDDFALGTACMSDDDIILKVFGIAAGENGRFDIYINKTNLISKPIQQPIVVTRRIKTTTTNDCPDGFTVSSTVQKMEGQSDKNISLIKYNEIQQFVFSENGRKVTFKIEEETHQPYLYKILFTPFALAADVFVTPLLFILPSS